MNETVQLTRNYSRELGYTIVERLVKMAEEKYGK